MELSDATLNLAGILLLSLVTVESGGAFMFRVVRGQQPATALQTSFFRAGHAHAGVLLILSLVLQLYVDATDLSGAVEWIARTGVPIAALLMPGGFFLSVIRPGTERPNRLVLMIPAGAVFLAAGLVATGVGLLTA
ncbi:MAG TPA: hypothetical protein VIL36_13745 [Acidimicrobiales bacterium]